MKIEIYKDKKGEWRWVILANNGRKIANSGEGYKRIAGVYKALRVLNAGFSKLVPIYKKGTKEILKLELYERF